MPRTKPPIDPPEANAGELITQPRGEPPGALLRGAMERQAEARFNERREQAIVKFGDGLPSWSMEHYESQIRHELGRSAESFLQAGKMLLVARACTTHGEWGGMLQRLNLGSDTALRMMSWAKHCAALPNPARVRDLTQSAGTIGKMIELCQLPPEQFLELSEGQTGELSLDDVARMTRDELRAAVRDARGDIEAKDTRAANQEREIESLRKQLSKARLEANRATPDETAAKLREKCHAAAFQCRADISYMGTDADSLFNRFTQLRVHAEDQGNLTAHDAYLGGLIGEVLAELRVLRDQLGLPIVGDYGDPTWSTGG